MRSSEDGGRKNAADLHGRYLPHVRVEGDETYLGVRFLSETERLIQPGETASITLELLYEVDYGALKPGVEFDVLEGPLLVGRGTVT